MSQSTPRRLTESEFPQKNAAGLNEALDELETLDPRQAQVVELRFFDGLTNLEIGEVMAISPATVKREWSVAKLWLERELTTSR